MSERSFMNRNDFLNAVIDDAIYEIIVNYTRPDQIIKKEGGLRGLEMCRGKSDEVLLTLLQTAQVATQRARDCELVDYWGVRMQEAQIEWILNVLSGALYMQRLPTLIAPTMRATMKAASILGEGKLKL